MTLIYAMYVDTKPASANRRGRLFYEKRSGRAVPEEKDHHFG
jgi:hypothetical protein